MKLEDFDYLLPQELIAQEPVEPRDSSRLLVLERESGRLRHEVFYDQSKGPGSAFPGPLHLYNPPPAMGTWRSMFDNQ
jgi:hypothetical protein